MGMQGCGKIAAACTAEGPDRKCFDFNFLAQLFFSHDRCLYRLRGKSIFCKCAARHAHQLRLLLQMRPSATPTRSEKCRLQLSCIGYRASNHSHLHSVLDKAESEMRTIPKHLCEIPSSLSHTTHEILPLPPQPRNLPSKQFFLRSRTSPAMSEPRD